jgi:uncharacterized protein YdaL
LAFCDLLFDVLAPATHERHRAVVRIEDVHPRSSPEKLRAIADDLAKRGVPFAIAVIPAFERPQAKPLLLKDAPEVVDAIEYMLERGGSLVLHGYTHQYGTVANPNDGVTGDDLEFFRAHNESNGRLVMDGPVSEDSPAWAEDRVMRALREIDDARLPRPRVFGYPNDAGSPVDSRAIAKLIGIAFQRETFFAGSLDRSAESTDRRLGLLFPFVVDDVYGWRVIPENIGRSDATTRAEDVLGDARALRVVRDGMAGFEFDPDDNVKTLEAMVDGMQSMGYRFVSMDEAVMVH